MAGVFFAGACLAGALLATTFFAVLAFLVVVALAGAFVAGDFVVVLLAGAFLAAAVRVAVLVGAFVAAVVAAAFFAGADWAVVFLAALLVGAAVDFRADDAVFFTPRVAPPRPRKLAPDSFRTPCTKPYDRPESATILRMLSPAAYRLAYWEASVLRCVPVMREPFASALATMPPLVARSSQGRPPDCADQ